MTAPEEKRNLLTGPLLAGLEANIKSLNELRDRFIESEKMRSTYPVEPVLRVESRYVMIATITGASLEIQTRLLRANNRLGEPPVWSAWENVPFVKVL